jgi:D-lyxose ketol-isomerase
MIVKAVEFLRKFNEDKVLDTINPTGSVFVDYTPEKRMIMKLGKNITTLDKTSGKSPETMITIYRGVPKGSQLKINPGDFITTNEQLAKAYAGTGVVLVKKVKMSDLLDDIEDPLGEEYIYRPKEA